MVMNTTSDSISFHGDVFKLYRNTPHFSKLKPYGTMPSLSGNREDAQQTRLYGTMPSLSLGRCPANQALRDNPSLSLGQCPENQAFQGNAQPSYQRKQLF